MAHTTADLSDLLSMPDWLPPPPTLIPVVIWGSTSLTEEGRQMADRAIQLLPPARLIVKELPVLD